MLVLFKQIIGSTLSPPTNIETLTVLIFVKPVIIQLSIDVQTRARSAQDGDSLMMMIP